MNKKYIMRSISINKVQQAAAEAMVAACIRVSHKLKLKQRNHKQYTCVCALCAQLMHGSRRHRRRPFAKRKHRDSLGMWS